MTAHVERDHTHARNARCSQNRCGDRETPHCTAPHSPESEYVVLDTRARQVREKERKCDLWKTSRDHARREPRLEPVRHLHGQTQQLEQHRQSEHHDEEPGP